MPASIRLARETDLPRLVEIYNSSIPARNATADLQPVTIESRQTWWQAHTPEKRPIWVYEREVSGVKIVIGWISLSSFYGRPAYDATAEVSLYIAEGFQGQGIGSALMQHAIEACPKLGVSTLLGFVFAHNQASQRLNKKFGFEVWGQLPQVANLKGKMADLLIVGLKIPANIDNSRN